jgi:cytochrome c553
MRRTIGVLLLAFVPAIASATDFPDWAYPVAPQNLPRLDPNKIVTVPGSDKKYNEVQVNDGYNPPDWFPNDHAPMPKVVSNGNQEAKVRACGLCHLTSGDGHPESSGIAGLPVAYAMRTMAEFKNGNRKGIRVTSMTEIANAITDEETRAAAEYFAGRTPLKGFTKVVESANVPKSYVGRGAMRFVTKDGGDEPIGSRIIELPQDEDGAHARNPRTGFVAHVPPGSIAKGQALATTGGGGKTITCTICHGPGLKGLGEVPPIANRSPMYVYRQLNDMKVGQRTGTAMALMKQVVEKLDVDDMIALSAYVGSLEP